MKTHDHSRGRLLFGAAGLAGLLLGASGATGADPGKASHTNWSNYGGGVDSMQYSPLDQINKSNIRRLELAWHYPVPDRTGNFGFNPVVVDGVMYVLGQQDNIVALNAATGEVIWSHAVPGGGSPGNRGIAYWESEDRSDRRLIYAARGALRQVNAKTGEAITSFGDNGAVPMRVGYPRVAGSPSGTPGRVFENLYISGSNTGEGYFSPVGDIRAYDVITGELAWTFRTIPFPGEYGYDTWPPEAWKYAGGANCWGEMSVDEERGIVYVTTGSPIHDPYGGDRIGANLFGNCLLALDARTGARLWHFQAVHHDLWDYDLSTAPKLLTVRHEGEQVDVVALPTKWGNLFVFNRETGEPLWPIEQRPVPQSTVPGEESWPTQPFQTRLPPFARQTFTVEDINPYLDEEERERIRERLLAAYNEGVFTPPILGRERVSIPGQFGGSNFGGSAADPETGMLYVRTIDHPTIHRLREWQPRGGRRDGGDDGPPEERGSRLYTQMCSVCHGAPQPNGIWTMDRAGMIAVRDLEVDHLMAHIREGQGQMPAFTEDILPEEDLQAVLTFLLGYTVDLTGRGGSPADEELVGRRTAGPRPLSAADEGMIHYTGPRYTDSFGSAWRASNRGPVISPPWSEIVAYDLNEGTIKWRAPFGHTPGLVARGITGTGNARRSWRAGPVVTGGGLIFIGSWANRSVHAFDKDTGEEVWDYTLKANPEGIVSVFEVGGRQYVAFCASGSAEADSPQEAAFEAWPGLASAQGYYVFALPETVASGTSDKEGR